VCRIFNKKTHGVIDLKPVGLFEANEQWAGSGIGDLTKKQDEEETLRFYEIPRVSSFH
jgi:hypothetical protein